jgi:lipoyl(octanoyl) transferase
MGVQVPLSAPIFILLVANALYNEICDFFNESYMINWVVMPELAPYEPIIEAMEAKVAQIALGAEEEIWLLEHPSLYTGGTSAKTQDLLNPAFPVYQSGRGGQYTYHGPEMRIIYSMLNVKARYAPKVPDVRHFVQTMEQWIIDVLQEFGIKGELRTGRIGIWVATKHSEAKIAALGIRISKGVSYHGAAINLNPDLSHYNGIVPCGIKQYGVTSMHQLGAKISMNELDYAIKQHCPFI